MSTNTNSLNMEGFIEGVRVQPCLWNPLHPEYRESHVKDEAWQRVVDYFKNDSIPNIQTAKIEWKRLRDNHRDALKRAKLGRNKLLPAQITTWKYAKAMQFLEPHMKYRITEHIEMEPPICASFSEHDVSTTEATDSVVNSCNPGPLLKRRCIERSNVSPVKTRQETDALDSFFNCILQSTREMPLWMQTQVKKRIFAVVIEAEEYLSSQDRNRDSFESHGNSVIVETKIKTETFADDSSDYNN